MSSGSVQSQQPTSTLTHNSIDHKSAKYVGERERKREKETERKKETQ